MIDHLTYFFVLCADSSQILAIEVCNCSTGSNVQMNLSNSENIGYRYYLNTAEPAHCNGTIKSIGYCYYGPNQYNNTRAWAAVVALYRSELDGRYRRVSDELILSKPRPSDPLSPNPETDLLLNFNCDTCALSSALHVQKGNMFGALVFADQRLLRLGGLDLIGDSSNGYLMMNRPTDQLGMNFRINESPFTLDVDLPEILDRLSPDTEKRVLHVCADNY